MKILLLIIAQILGDAQFDWVKNSEISFDKLPAICQKAYNKDIFEFMNPATTKVSFVDLNGDNKNEIIAWDGQYSSGGMGWNIISNEECIGNVCGTIAIVKNGLLVKHNTSWKSATFSYYKQQDNKLISKFSVEVTYSPTLKKMSTQKIKSFKVNLL